MEEVARFLLRVIVFLLSMLVSMEVLERASMSIKSTLIFGARQPIYGDALLAATCICVLLFLWAFILYRRPTTKGLKHMLGVSMYLNFITLMVILLMLAVPLVKIRF